MKPRPTTLGLLLVSGLGLAFGPGCGGRGAVTFALTTPENPELDPLARGVTSYSLRTSSGRVVASSTGGAGASKLVELGPLEVEKGAVDVTLSLLAAGQLVGMGRVRDVAIAAGKSIEYNVEARKPIVYIGSSEPPDRPVDLSIGSELPVGEAQIFDPTTSRDLVAEAGLTPLPQGITASAVTTDGRYLLASVGNQLRVFETGTGELLSERVLGFTAQRLRVAPRDAFVALLDVVGNRLVLLEDLAALVAAVDEAPARTASLGEEPRDLRLSPDGSRAYVLGGGFDLDPCDSMTEVPPNRIQVFDTRAVEAGAIGEWSFDRFIAALALDPASGDLLLAEQAGYYRDETTGKVRREGRTDKPLYDNKDLPGGVNRIPASLAFGQTRGQRVLEDLICPTALATSGAHLLVVSSEHDLDRPNTFLLRRAKIDGTEVVSIAVKGPLFEAPVGISSAAGRSNIALQAYPASLSAYELSIAADGNRAVLATRAGYRIRTEQIDVLLGDRPCYTYLDAVEYGLYKLDTITGNAAYESRSVLLTSNQSAHPCLLCPGTVASPTTFAGRCVSRFGDRVSGLSAIFEEP